MKEYPPLMAEPICKDENHYAFFFPDQQDKFAPTHRHSPLECSAKNVPITCLRRRRPKQWRQGIKFSAFFLLYYCCDSRDSEPSSSFSKVEDQSLCLLITKLVTVVGTVPARLLGFINDGTLL